MQSPAGQQSRASSPEGVAFGVSLLCPYLAPPPSLTALPLAVTNLIRLWGITTSDHCSEQVYHTLRKLFMKIGWHLPLPEKLMWLLLGSATSWQGGAVLTKQDWPRGAEEYSAPTGLSDSNLRPQDHLFSALSTRCKPAILSAAENSTAHTRIAAM